MFLVTGPAGSGKTAFVLDRFREALRAGNDAIRLLAPTATMAQHLQNRIARGGCAFRRHLIQTLSGPVKHRAARFQEYRYCIFRLKAQKLLDSDTEPLQDTLGRSGG